MKKFEERTFIMALIILIYFFILLFIPIFWNSFEYTGEIINAVKFSITIKNLPLLFYRISLFILINAGICYLISNFINDIKINGLGLALTLIANGILLIINIYGLIFILYRTGVYGNLYQTYFIWQVIHIGLNIFLIIGISIHTNSIKLLMSKQFRYHSRSEKGIINPILIIGILVSAISIFIIFIPSVWNRYFMIKIPRYSNLIGNMRYNILYFSIFQIIIISIIFGLAALINVGLCYIIAGIQDYRDLKKVGFVLGICISVIFSFVNILILFATHNAIIKLYEDILYYFTYFSNIGFDVPASPEVAFISAVFMVFGEFQQYQMDIIWTRTHVILDLTILILVIISTKFIYIKDPW